MSSLEQQFKVRDKILKDVDIVRRIEMIQLEIDMYFKLIY